MSKKIFPNNQSNIVLKTENSTGKLLNKVNNIEMVELELLPGSFVPSHSLPVDVVFYVIEGSGKLEVNGETNNLASGDSVHVFKNEERIWTNNTDKKLKLLVTKHMNE